MNDLVSEYQQYQDATAEGKFPRGVQWPSSPIDLVFLSLFAEEGEGGEEEGEHDGA